MKKAFYILALMLTVVTATCYGQTNQRHITPVEVTTNRTLLPRKGEKLKYIERDSLTLDSLRRDSIAKIYPHYPLITDVTIGANVFDAIAKLFGQSYSSYDASLTVNMWNRLFPTLEVGLGRANSTPDGMNYTYKTKLAPYFKLGANYNFMFKSHPDYVLFAGFRVAYTTFSYDVTNIAINDNYWGESTVLNIDNQKSHALWGEIALGLKVKLWGPISAGWTFKYHNLFKYKKNTNSEPWYIPGFGTRGSALGACLSVYYTIPMSKKKWPKIDENGKLLNLTNQQPSGADSGLGSTPNGLAEPGTPTARPADKKSDKATDGEKPSGQAQPANGQQVQSSSEKVTVVAE